MRWLVGGSYGGVGVAMPQSLRGVGVTREDVLVSLLVEFATVFEIVGALLLVSHTQQDFSHR